LALTRLVSSEDILFLLGVEVAIAPHNGQAPIRVRIIAIVLGSTAHLVIEHILAGDSCGLGLQGRVHALVEHHLDHVRVELVHQLLALVRQHLILLALHFLYELIVLQIFQYLPILRLLLLELAGLDLLGVL